MTTATAIRTSRTRVKGRRNYLGGLFGWIWLAIIILPIYYVVVTSFKDQGDYFTSNPLSLPLPPAFTAYQQVIDAGIGLYFMNSVIVTIGTVVPVVLFGFLAAYAIVRGNSRLLRYSRWLFLLGLAIPLQATIIPIYLIITKIHMYDSLGALILPSIAFGIPLTVLILLSGLGSVSNQSIEAARDVGAGRLAVLWHIILPRISNSILVAVSFTVLGIFSAFTLPYVLGPAAPEMMGPFMQRTFRDLNDPTNAITQAVIAFCFCIVFGLFYVRSVAKNRSA